MTRFMQHLHAQVALLVEDELLFPEQALDIMPMAASDTRVSARWTKKFKKSKDKKSVLKRRNPNV